MYVVRRAFLGVFEVLNILRSLETAGDTRSPTRRHIPEDWGSYSNSAMTALHFGRLALTGLRAGVLISL